MVRLESLEDAAHAIRAMLVRGAPLIGATAAYGMALAMRADAFDARVWSGLPRHADGDPADRGQSALGDRRPVLATNAAQPAGRYERVAAAWTSPGS